MKEFSLLSFAAFVAEGGELIYRVSGAHHHALEKVGEIVEKQAKEYIGTYDAEPQWPQLAEATQNDRSRKGYPPNDPLLREGTLRDSIEHKVEGDEVYVGSNFDIAVYQELGTSRIPPRPFLQTAAVASEHKITELIGTHTVRALSGELAEDD